MDSTDNLTTHTHEDSGDGICGCGEALEHYIVGAGLGDGGDCSCDSAVEYDTIQNQRVCVQSGEVVDY